MAITGGIKIFKDNEALISKSVTAAASPSGDPSADFILDRNVLTHWRSVGSDDTTTETLTITFPGAITIDRIHILDHNFEDFDIMYDGGAGFVNFTNVIGLDGAVIGGIIETAFADDSAYYEFDSATLGGAFQIRIRANTTQVTDAEKFLNQLVASEELGTFNGFPSVNPVASRNSRISTALSGRLSIQKANETLSVSLGFDSYPASGDFVQDWTIVYTLFDREETFLVWISGGIRGITKFGVPIRAFRLRDVKAMQITDDFSSTYRDNIYVNPINLELNMAEVIDG